MDVMGENPSIESGIGLDGGKGRVGSWSLKKISPRSYEKSKKKTSNRDS